MSQVVVLFLTHTLGNRKYRQDQRDMRRKAREEKDKFDREASEILTYDRIQLRNYISSLMAKYNDKTAGENADMLLDGEMKPKDKKKRKKRRDPQYLKSFLDLYT